MCSVSEITSPQECSGILSVAMCCSVLQCVAVCCSVLQCVAVCCSGCSVLQCVAVSCSVLQCAAVCLNMEYGMCSVWCVWSDLFTSLVWVSYVCTLAELLAGSPSALCAYVYIYICTYIHIHSIWYSVHDMCVYIYILIYTHIYICHMLHMSCVYIYIWSIWCLVCDMCDMTCLPFCVIRV